MISRSRRGSASRVALVMSGSPDATDSRMLVRHTSHVNCEEGPVEPVGTESHPKNSTSKVRVISAGVDATTRRAPAWVKSPARRTSGIARIMLESVPIERGDELLIRASKARANRHETQLVVPRRRAVAGLADSDGNRGEGYAGIAEGCPTSGVAPARSRRVVVDFDRRRLIRSNSNCSAE